MPGPNIVFIHVDQMHHAALSAYGCEHVRTPNMDRIARDGTSFMQSYAAMPQCCPARASWYTGRTSKEHGVVVNGYPIDPSLPDLGQWLAKRGYECVYTGKWHVSGRDVAKSFRVLHRGSGHGELGDSAVARSAVAYLRNRKSAKPFFLNVGFLNPHDCCFPAAASGGPAKYGFARKIRDELPPLPANFDHGYRETGSPRTRNWTLQDWRYYIYGYYRMVEMVDHEVGRVYEALRGSPYRDDTLFILASDHGDGLGFHAKVSKGYLEEEASRVPAMVSWPGVVPAGVRDTEHLVSGVDVAATVCDYAEAPPLPKMTVARSWRPLLEAERDGKRGGPRARTHIDWRDYVVCETSIGALSACVRDIRYKSIIYEERTRLYDIREDPLETKDLADDAAHAAVRRRHREHFREHISRIEPYPGPPGVDRMIERDRKEGRAGRRRRPRFQGGNRYREYVEWYAKVLAEG